MKQFFSLLLVLSVMLFAHTSAFAIKIGVVNLNQALNESETGIRYKHVLETESRQKQEALKLEEEDLRKLADDIQNNPLLSPDSKRQKEQDFKERQSNLREKVRSIEQELRAKERQFTEEVFKELKSAIRTVAMKNKYDLVLEKNASEIILYMKEEKTDFTQEVIDYYNQLKSEKK
ncbi:OmpH family outer membrane protein [Deltaproteobacteria bacterium TL4]